MKTLTPCAIPWASILIDKGVPSDQERVSWSQVALSLGSVIKEVTSNPSNQFMYVLTSDAIGLEAFVPANNHFFATSILEEISFLNSKYLWNLIV